MCCMPGNGQKKTRRAVVIIHPDFEQPGKQGIIEAKNFAEQLINSHRELIKTAAESQPPHVVDSIRAHVGAIHVIVRNLDEDIF